MTKKELSKLLDEKLRGVATKEDIGRLEKRVASLDQRLSSVAEQMPTKKDLNAMEKRLMTRFDQLFNFLDKDVMENRRRMDKIDERLDVLESQVQAAIA